MRLEVLTGTAEEFEHAIVCPCGDVTRLDSILQKISTEQVSVASFQSVVPSEKQSDNFSIIGDIMRAMLTFMDTHTYPEKIRIVCDSEETARLYKVIYNFWFAEEKAERMDDDSWD